MKFTVEREHLLKPLQQVSGPLGGRPTLPILGNLLLQVADGTLSLTGTDLEMEMVARVALVQPHEPGATTVPARKFFDICRGLPEGAEIAVQLEGERMLVRSGRSRFSLSTLPAADFPNLDDWQSEVEFTLPQATMKRLIEATQFSMAHQDVRYYLNGMLFETEGEELRTVATDGHRLAVCSMPIGQSLPSHSVIVPRKGVIELMRMLDGGDNPLRVQIGSNNIRAHVGDFIFTSKLVDGRFPDYRRVLPKNPDKHLEAGCDLLKQAFARAAILSNEKFRGVRLYVSENQLKITANNPEQEEAEEILAKLKEGAGQMPVSDKNHMEAGKMASGALEGAEKEPEQLCYAWKTSTDIRAMEPMHQAFAAITAVQLWRWRQSRQFCGRCGAKTQDSKNERALVCPVCGQTEYPKISPAVIVAITNGNKLLMSRYRVNHSTYRGYALIAGFVEIGETLEETVRREVMACISA